MRHTDKWYADLAASLGHSGYVTLGEIRQAEAREAREIAASAKWTRHAPGPYYYHDGLTHYVIAREASGRNWFIDVLPPLHSAVPRKRQRGIRTLTEAKGLALAQPCFRCGLASPLALMTPVLPERPGQRTGASPRFRCLDTSVCLGARAELTGTEPARMEVRIW